ncbi:unnamed protein product [Rotaria sp. Silwood2]|nr:unnamed protein product [Rotaria sp. Silwood2]CAF3281231.1 unnamed protein product [Rotaria sp. Silwood2]CAF3346422.1 unnamed protein product [Rotaria sp. Silwood2]CAF4139603.1 unnamed protein product [Rotaria sp. Silwood2]CAF4496276.1 unnamed protein product [Rotaria sp. Silwood2]
MSTYTTSVQRGGQFNYETRIIHADHSVTTITTVDKTDHADEDNHTTAIGQITTSPDLEKLFDKLNIILVISI